MERGPPPPTQNSRFAAAAADHDRDRETEMREREERYGGGGFGRRDEQGPPPVQNSRFAAAVQGDGDYVPHDARNQMAREREMEREEGGGFGGDRGGYDDDRRGGGGFGAKAAATPSVASISADKHALEAQWDTFASVTDLEIAPPGDPDDEDYEHFIVADVFVRIGPGEDEEGTGWFRTGKAMAAGDDADIRKALTLQKGLIFWTASHMWPQLASKGKTAATRMELGYAPPSMTMPPPACSRS